MKRFLLSVFGSAAMVLAASADIRSITPVPRENVSWWMPRHRERLAAIAAATNAVYDVVFVGDSAVQALESRPHSRVRAFGPGKLSVLFAGSHDDRTEHVLWRLTHGELDGCRAKVVVVQVGTGNAGQLPLGAETPIDTIAGVKRILDVIRERQPQAKVVLQAILPRGRDASDPVRRRNAAVNREIRRFCDGEKVIWLDVGASFLTRDGRLSRHLADDGVNLTTAGCNLWVDATLPLLREICRTPGGDRGPYPAYGPGFVPDDEWTDAPQEVAGETPLLGRIPNRENGPFGDWWWLNRLHNRRERIAALKGGTVDVVFLGDSIMHFWEWHHPAAWKKFTSRHSALNCGYGGDTTQAARWRAENGELDGYRAKVVVLMIGTNNSSYGSPAERIAAGVRACLDTVRRKQPQAKVVLQAIFPRGADTPESRKVHEKARANNEKVNAIIRNFADGKDVIWLDFNAKWTPDGWGVPKELMADAIHPTDAGYDLWMSELEPILKEYVK